MSDYDKIKIVLDEIEITYTEDLGEFNDGTKVLTITIDQKNTLPNYDEDGLVLVPVIVFDTNGKFIRFEFRSEE